MADNNKMTIIEALVKLRNDLKLWVANNLRVKLDKNLGAEAKHKILGADAEGNVTPTNITWGEPTGTVILEEQEFTPFSKLLETYGCSVNYAIADITVGETYSVIWDGVATTCTAVQDGACTSLVCDGKFSINILNNMTILTAFTDTSATHIVGIVHIGANTSMAIGDDFVVYSDGHAEVQTMGETDNSVATKQYVDNAVANGAGSPGEGGDMAKATYDTDNDGIVDNAAQLEGHPADYFATAEHAHTYESLIDAPDITQDPEDEVLYVVDGSGNIIATVGAAGLETTTVTAKAVVVDGADVQATYATKQYVDDAIAQKSQVQFITWEADD